MSVFSCGCVCVCVHMCTCVRESVGITNKRGEEKELWCELSIKSASRRRWIVGTSGKVEQHAVLLPFDAARFIAFL